MVQMPRLWPTTTPIFILPTLTSFSVSHQTLHKETSLTRSGGALICGYGDANLEGGLKLCPFARITLVSSPLEPLGSLTVGSWSG